MMGQLETPIEDISLKKKQGTAMSGVKGSSPKCYSKQAEAHKGNTQIKEKIQPSLHKILSEPLIHLKIKWLNEIAPK